MAARRPRLQIRKARLEVFPQFLKTVFELTLEFSYKLSQGFQGPGGEFMVSGLPVMIPALSHSRRRGTPRHPLILPLCAFFAIEPQRECKGFSFSDDFHRNFLFFAPQELLAQVPEI